MVDIIACDPGSKGCIGRIRFNGDVQAATIEDYVLLSSIDKFNLGEVQSWLMKQWADMAASPNGARIYLERPFAAGRGQGNALLIQGMNYGAIWGVIRSSGYVVHEISPSTWKSDFGLRKRNQDNWEETVKLAIKLVGKKTLTPKKCSIPHEGLVDTLLIAYYAYLNFVKR